MITLSPGLPEHQITRALAHALAEIQVLDAPGFVPSPTDGADRTSP